jgi:PhzF family phenazine biosynthesis protein
MAIPYTIVDAFTSRPFSGNPAAVCLLAHGFTSSRGETATAWMQRVARELNLSETAFVEPRDEGYALRWFTPLVEVDLCGHATLATAHALAAAGRASLGQPITFSTRSGVLNVVPSADGWIEMDFPAIPSAASPLTAPYEQALGIEPVFAGMAGPRHLFEVESEAAVTSLRPDFDALRRLPGRAVIVTSRATRSGFDIVSRYFAPWVGVEEDPVTGVAHCALAVYWTPKLGKSTLTAWQASARGGELQVALEGDRVRLRGQAVTVARGTLDA